MMKRCSKCTSEKEAKENFYKSNQTKDGFYAWCKKCVNQRQSELRIVNKDKFSERHKNRTEEQIQRKKKTSRKWELDNRKHRREYAREYHKYRQATDKVYREKRKEKRYKSRYGIGFKEIEFILKSQKYKCSICGCELSMNYKFLDHNHKTNKMREFLCNGCNLILGHCDDSKEILMKAIQYLEKHA